MRANDKSVIVISLSSKSIMCIVQATFKGVVLNSFKFRKKPRFTNIPSRKTCHNRDAPKLANAELINKSCLTSASAKEQLGVSSPASAFSSSSLNSSVTNGNVLLTSNFFDAGCCIVAMVDSTTCPVSLLLPKSIQYKG